MRTSVAPPLEPEPLGTAAPPERADVVVPGTVLGPLDALVAIVVWVPAVVLGTVVLEALVDAA